MMKNHKLAQAIADASWAELLRQLDYKCQWYGRTLVKIDRWFPSSKRCGNCGHVVDKLPLDVREWDCPECGTHHDRDINAAQNILAAGLAVIVCGASDLIGMSLLGSCEIPTRERNRNPSRESWESPRLQSGEDVNFLSRRIPRPCFKPGRGSLPKREPL